VVVGVSAGAGITQAGFFLEHVVALVLLAATASAAGRLLSGRLDGSGPAERLAVSAALGLALLAHLLFFLGLLGLLKPCPLLAALAAIHLLGRGVWRELAERRPPPWAAVAGLAALGPLFVLALYPPIAFDETLYHLPMARAFARAGALPFLPELRVPVFPPLHELLSAGMLLTAGDVATHLVPLLATLLTAALVALGIGLELGRAAGVVAAAAFLGNPIVVHLAVTGHVEASLTLFVTAALFAMRRWRASGRGLWLALAGAFAGTAAGTKYFGLFFVASLGVEAALAAPRGRKLRNAALFGLVALAVLAPVYGRIVAWTGNPVFPFCTALFGPNEWKPLNDLPDVFHGRLASLAELPWNALFDRESAGAQPPVSPLALLGVPLLAAAALRDKRMRPLLAHGALYTLLVPSNARYLVPILPLSALGLGLGAAQARLLRRRWLAAALGIVCFLPGWLYAGYRIALQGPVPVTAERRDAFLAERMPAYPAVRFLNLTAGRLSTVYAVHAENMKYFFDGVMLGEWSGPASYDRVLPEMQDPERLYRALRGLGADRLLIAGEPRLPETPPFGLRFRRVYRDEACEVYELL
jgi:dolichyl-phosphate-mannose-protein mannosyltransferase